MSSSVKAFMLWAFMAIWMLLISGGAWTFLRDSVALSHVDSIVLSVAYASALVAGYRIQYAREFVVATATACASSYRIASVIGSGDYGIFAMVSVGVVVGFGFFAGLFFQRVARFLG